MKVYAVMRCVTNGVDYWEYVHGVYLNERAAEIAEINLFLNNKEPATTHYTVVGWDVNEDKPD